MCFVLVKCAPGTYSASGVEPCQPCEKGFYQPDEGKLSCFPCKGKTSTYGPGAKSESFCLGKSQHKSSIFVDLHNRPSMRTRFTFHQLLVYPIVISISTGMITMFK